MPDPQKVTEKTLDLFAQMQHVRDDLVSASGIMRDLGMDIAARNLYLEGELKRLQAKLDRVRNVLDAPTTPRSSVTNALRRILDEP